MWFSPAVNRMFRAFSDPMRLRILHLLRGGELCVCDLVEIFESASADCLPSFGIPQTSRTDGRAEEGLLDLLHVDVQSKGLSHKAARVPGYLFQGRAGSRARAKGLMTLTTGGCLCGRFFQTSTFDCVQRVHLLRLHADTLWRAAEALFDFPYYDCLAAGLLIGGGPSEPASLDRRSPPSGRSRTGRLGQHGAESASLDEHRLPRQESQLTARTDPTLSLADPCR